jgi:hypothetical protein
VIDLSVLTYNLTDSLQRVPELVAQLSNGDAEMIVAYVDSNPYKSNVVDGQYTMPPGSILVSYENTAMTQGNTGMSQWTHYYNLHVRGARGRADGLKLLTLLMNGVPVPGDGQRWYRCPLLDGLSAAQVNSIMRETDAEGLDYFVVLVEFQETGDA